MTTECEEFFKGLKAIDPELRAAAIDFVFEAIDEWCCAAKLALIDEVLGNVAPGSISNSALLGFLTITISCPPGSVPARSALVERTREHFSLTMDAATVACLLKGL